MPALAVAAIEMNERFITIDNKTLIQNTFLYPAIRKIYANEVTVKSLLISLFTVQQLLANGLSRFVTSRRLCTKVSIVTKKLFEICFRSSSHIILTLSTVYETVCFVRMNFLIRLSNYPREMCPFSTDVI